MASFAGDLEGGGEEMKNRKDTFLFNGLLRLVLLLSLLLVSHNIRAATENKAMPWIPLLLLSNTVTITISGKATIPNYTPTRSLALLVDGLDGNIYGAGISDPDGNFSIKTSIPKGTRRVLVYAVDPNNPEFYVKAYVDLDESSNESKSLSGPLGSRISSKNGPITSIKTDVTTTLDARSLAESIVSDYSARQKSDFTQTEWDAVSTITNALRDGTYNHRLCSTEQNPQINALLKTLAQNTHFLPDIRLKIGSFVQGQGDLITRLRRAQKYVTDSVTSSNYKTTRGAGITNGIGGLVIIGLGFPAIGWGVFLTSAGKMMYDEFHVDQTRNFLDSLNLPSLRGDTTGWISRLDLELAATIIVDVWGYGNCQEKGIAGAYIASRFNEFKQVAHVVSETDLYEIRDGDFAAHSFSIACTENESKYNIEDLSVAPIIDGWVKPPKEFFSAGCYLVDPWAGKVELITEEMVASERWHNILHVMKVDLTGQNSESNGSTAPQQLHQVKTNFKESALSKTDQTCPVNFTCNTCPSKSELNDSVCQPFILPGDKFACCASDGTCSEITLKECEESNGTPQNGVASCTENLCPQPVGACCGALGVCYETGQAPCEAAGDTYKGTGTTCTPGLCPAPKEYVVYTIDSWTCFEARIVTVGERSKFQEEELLCNYFYYADNTCTQIASKTEMQGGFATREDGYEWLDGLKGEWMLNRWCPGNGYYRLEGKEGWYMIF